MIEGPVGDMLERNHAVQDFKAPPYFDDVRPMALQSAAFTAALMCADPRLDESTMFVLEGASGRYRVTVESHSR